MWGDESEKGEKKRSKLVNEILQVPVEQIFHIFLSFFTIKFPRGKSKILKMQFGLSYVKLNSASLSNFLLSIKLERSREKFDFVLFQYLLEINVSYLLLIVETLLAQLDLKFANEILRPF